MWKKNITLNVRFLSGQHRFTIKGFTRDISDIYVGTLNILYSFGYQKTMRHIDGILCEILHNYGSLLPHIIINQWRINRLHYMLDRFFFPSHNYNWLLQMSKRWKKYPTYNVSFPREKHRFKITYTTTDNDKIYVSTFKKYIKSWFLKNWRNI